MSFKTCARKPFSLATYSLTESVHLKWSIPSGKRFRSWKYMTITGSHHRYSVKRSNSYSCCRLKKSAKRYGQIHGTKKTYVYIYIYIYIYTYTSIYIQSVPFPATQSPDIYICVSCRQAFVSESLLPGVSRSLQ